MEKIKVGEVNLAYEVRGSGPPVVNINGTGLAAALWWQLGVGQKLLDAGYQVIAFDNRGIPPTDVPPSPYTVEQMAQDAIGLLEHLDRGPYVLIGASLGGLIAQTVALQRSDLVRAVVFKAGCGNIAAFSQGRAMVDLLGMGNPPKSVMTALMLPAFIPPPLWGNDAAVRAAIELSSHFTPSDPAGLLGQYYADLKWSAEDHLEELADLKTPALAIANEYCCIFPPALVRQAVARMPLGRYVEIAGAAHVAMHPEQREKADSAVLQFLAQHVPT